MSFLFKEGLHTLGIRLVNMVFAAALGIMTARLLGPEGRGVYALPIINSGFVVAFLGGLSTATSFMLLNKKYGRGVLRVALQTSLLFFIAGAGVVTAIAFIAHQAWAALPAALVLPSACAISVATGYWFGVHRVQSANRLRLALTLVTLLLMTVGLIFIARNPTVAITAWLGANLLVGGATLLDVVLHARHLPADQVPFWPYFSFASKIGTIGIVQLLNLRADIYVVALFTTPAALGIYGVAVAGAESLLIVTQVASVVTMPHIGSLDQEQAALLTARCCRNNFMLAIVICIGIIAAAPLLVGLLYGHAFSGAVLPLRVLLIGVAGTSLGGVISSFYTIQMGNPRVVLVVSGASAAACIILSILLVPKMGILGAAIGSTVAYIVAQIVTISYFSRTARLPVWVVIFPQREDFEFYKGFLQKTAAGVRDYLARRSGRSTK